MTLRCLIAEGHTGAVCFWCEGRGRVERYVHRLRRRALVPCEHCEGTGRQ